jgi:uncharacterized membrane protein
LYSTRTTVAILVLVVVAFVVSGYYYEELPDPMASHWNAAGDVDGFVAKSWGAFTAPVILLLLWLVATFLPIHIPKSLLPRRSGRVTGFIFVLFLFLAAIHVQLIQWNLGRQISFDITIPIGIGVLFFSLGMMLGSVEPNWLVGIRTYWTLKNPVVWRATHQRAALLFKILGLVYLAAIFFRGYLLFFILLPALFVALYLVGYSFVLSQKLEGTVDGRPQR